MLSPKARPPLFVWLSDNPLCVCVCVCVCTTTYLSIHLLMDTWAAFIFHILSIINNQIIKFFPFKVRCNIYYNFKLHGKIFNDAPGIDFKKQ